MVATVALVSCGGESVDPATRTTVPRANAVVVDLRAGSYRGVRLGSTQSQLFAKFGRGISQGAGTTLSNPLDTDGGPWYVPAPDGAPRSIHRYRYLVASLGGRRVQVLHINDPRARTGEGVAIGDSLAHVTDVYEDAVCGVVNEGSEYKPYPACHLDRSAGPYVWFGLDPIQSIWLTAVKIDDLSPKS